MYLLEKTTSLYDNKNPLIINSVEVLAFICIMNFITLYVLSDLCALTRIEKKLLINQMSIHNDNDEIV